MFKSKCCDVDAIINMSPDFLGDDPRKMRVGTCSFSCPECGEPCDIRPIEEVVGEMKNKEKKEVIIEDGSLTITRGSNGYELRGVNDSGGKLLYFIQDANNDELKSHGELLWYIMEYFAFSGSKHDKERLQIIRKKQK